MFMVLRVVESAAKVVMFLVTSPPFLLHSMSMLGELGEPVTQQSEVSTVVVRQAPVTPTKALVVAHLI
jgi:uncharacterized protein YigA (DUF484 family)